MKIKTKKVKKVKKPNYRERVKKLEKELDKAWSEAVRKRDVSCRKCNGMGALSAHHAFGRRHESTRWDLDNGVLLCLHHHLWWAHRDPGGFAVWFRSHVGVDVYERLAECHVIPALNTEDDLISKLACLREYIKSTELLC